MKLWRLFSQSALKTLTVKFYKQVRKILYSVKLTIKVFERWVHRIEVFYGGESLDSDIVGDNKIYF
jgi:hypothetical protein